MEIPSYIFGDEYEPYGFRIDDNHEIVIQYRLKKS